MDDYSLIVIGASAGGIEPLVKLVAGLPAHIPAAICVVVHFPSYSTSLLPSILARAGSLPARHAVNNEPLLPGHIYAAPPDRHLLVADGHVRVLRGPKFHSHRPAIDPLFRSAAQSFGPRAIGVVLSGMLDDGTLGLLAIKRQAGLAIVQSPQEALFESMPANAITSVAVDYIVSVADMGDLLMRLSTERQFEPLPDPTVTQEERSLMFEHLTDDDESAVVSETKVEQEHGLRAGQPSLFTCPDCGGVLWELSAGETLHYRCHVGHSYSAESLEAEQANILEGALWSAVRLLEENASLSRRLAHRARESGHQRSFQQFESRASEHEQRASLLRQLLMKGDWSTISGKVPQEIAASMPDTP